MLRTLLGLSPDRADRLAAETWRHVARDLAGYSGDEHGFRALGRSRSGGSASATPCVTPAPPPVRPARRPGRRSRHRPPDPTTQAIALVRRLPPAQAEAVLLRVVGGLDALTLADRMRSSHGDARALYCAGLVALSRRWTSRRPTSVPAVRRRRRDRRAARGGVSRLDPDRVEALLDDPSFEPEGATEVRIADLVAVLRAPARESELVGEPAALAAYESTPPTRSRQRRAAQHTAMIVAVGFAVTLTTATAAAAVTGSLPRGVQEFAHTLVGAPAPAGLRGRCTACARPCRTDPSSVPAARRRQPPAHRWCGPSPSRGSL